MTISWRQFLLNIFEPRLAYASSLPALFHDPYFNKNENNLWSPQYEVLKL